MATSKEAPKRLVDETIRLYSGILTKPVVASQLVRPSFQFIQEIVKRLITETRTLRDVFNPSDFDTEKKVWDKRMKADFIQKLLNHAAKNEQPVVGCVAAKVVAGLEPSKTNELLQALARLALARINGQDGSGGRARTFTRSSAMTNKPHQRTATVQRVLMSGGRGSSSGLSSAGTASSGAKLRRSSNNQSNDTQINQPVSLNEEPIAKPTRDSESSQISSNLKSLPTDSSKSTMEQQLSEIEVAPQQKREESTIVTVSSESEISKHIPQLKSDLKKLRHTMSDIEQMEEQLRLIFLRAHS